MRRGSPIMAGERRARPIVQPANCPGGQLSRRPMVQPRTVRATGYARRHVFCYLCVMATASAIGIYGLGVMGRSLALNIAGRGGAVTGFDPWPEARAALAQSGIAPAGTV